MNIIVTGAGGFVGSRVADALLSDSSTVPVARLLLVDRERPPARRDARVSTLALDLAAPGAADRLVQPDSHILFHLAAIVSGQAETDFDLGFQVNFDATRALLEAARRKVPTLRFVFSSTSAVFGGHLPPMIDEFTAVTPQTSYGAQKAMCELLINDYSRKGYVDGRILRLPTVSVRAGTANAAVTSFASGLVREPLAGLECVCPVPPEQCMWLTSPRRVVTNILHAAMLPGSALGAWRSVNLPGVCASVRDMVGALRAAAGDAVAALVRFERDEQIARMVASFPVKFDNTHALQLGFTVDKDFDDIVQAYITEDLRS